MSPNAPGWLAFQNGNSFRFQDAGGSAGFQVFHGGTGKRANRRDPKKSRRERNFPGGPVENLDLLFPSSAKT